MKDKDIGPIDLKTSQVTDEVFIDYSGPISVQPITTNLCGSPTYTLEVSNEKDNFVPYNPDSTDVSFEDVVQIDYAKIPWLYMRISVTSKTGDSGEARFIFVYNG